MSTHQHYENFPVGSWLLPKRLRAPIATIYAFARSADDIADEGTANQAERLAVLAQYRAELQKIKNGELPSAQSFWPDLAQHIHTYNLPISAFMDLISAFEQDVTFTPHTNWQSLLDYSACSANPVGLLLLHLLGAAQTENVQLSNQICTGLQLANFWQDVGQDFARGRIYLPQNLMQQFDLTENDLQQMAQSKESENLMRLLQKLCLDTHTMLRSGHALPARVAEHSQRFGFELACIIAGGHAILRKIKQQHYQVIGRAAGQNVPRIKLSTLDWCVALFHALKIRFFS